MARKIMDDTRLVISMPADLKARIRDYRFSARVSSEAEAIRRLIVDGLNAAEPKVGSDRPDAVAPATKVVPDSGATTLSRADIAARIAALTRRQTATAG